MVPTEPSHSGRHVSRRPWRVAWAAACVGALALGTLAVRCADGSALSAPSLRRRASKPYVNTPAAIPVDWETLPIVARMDKDATFVTGTSSAGFLEGAIRYEGRLGDLFVTYEEHGCSAGGSACAQAASGLDGLRVGDRDDDGRPMIDTHVSCTRTLSSKPEYDTPKRSSCAPESLALRRTSDGRVSVVSFRDPDDTETVIAAFSREPVRPNLATARSRRSLFFVLLPIALFSVGCAALLWARRYYRRHGILSYSHADLENGMLKFDDKIFGITGGIRIADGSLLVDPREIARARGSHGYREGAPAIIGAHCIYRGSHAGARVRAGRIALLAVVAFLGSAVVVSAVIALQ